MTMKIIRLSTRIASTKPAMVTSGEAAPVAVATVGSVMIGDRCIGTEGRKLEKTQNGPWISTGREGYGARLVASLHALAPPPPPRGWGGVGIDVVEECAGEFERHGRKVR